MILIDGDIVAYRCAYKSQEDRAEYAAYSAGSYLSDLISDLYILIEDEPEYRVYLTGKGESNFRHDYAVTAGYKENRKDKEKPEHLAARQQDVDEDKKVHKGVENEEDDITVPVCLEVRSYR